MSIVIRGPGWGRVSWELPASRLRRTPESIVKGGRRTTYELAAAIAATGRKVELRGAIIEPVFEEICSAAGARPTLDLAPRLPTAADTILFGEGWPNPLYAPYVLSGARCIMMILGPPGLAGWPYTEDAWEKPDPLTVDPHALARPEHFRAIAGLGCEMWTNSSGIAAASHAAGVQCAYIGSGQPQLFPEPVDKEFDLVVLEHNRWAPLALAVAESAGRSLLRVPRSDHDSVLRQLGSARILVWPSRIEGHSRIQVEARAMGTVPVALSSNRFAEGLSEEGGAVSVDSVEEMAPAITDLLDRPDELARLAALAAESARAHVDWDSYVERVDAVLSAAPPATEGAAAKDRIVGELARNEYRLRAQIAAAQESAGKDAGQTAPRARGRAGLSALWRRARGRGGRRTPARLRPRRPAAPAGGKPTVYVAGGYLPRGGGYMAYHLGRIVAERFDRRCRVVTLKGESAGHGRWQYPEVYEAVSREEMESAITDDDLLIANPSFSANQFGVRLRGRKLMYVQGFGRPVIDGFFNGYVCASDFLRDLLRTLYSIEAPVIPPFAHLDRIPAGPPWRERPGERILVVTKTYGEGLLERVESVMRRAHREIPYSLSVAEPMAHAALLERMSQHRYFLSLSPREGFGLIQLEAMAAGCAVAGFHGGGGMHFMRPGHNCEAVGYPAVEALCEGLAKVLTDAGAAEQLAARGRETAMAYDLAAFEERWVAYLEGFLDRRANVLR